MHPTSEPGPPRLNVFDAVMLIVGIVVGAGIFALPSMVAANTGSPERFLGAWVLGGLVSLCGALCYAELATAYPNSGGEHHFLRRAFGPRLGFLFAWARLAVLQPGSIAIQAFIVGDYLVRLAPRGVSSEVIAALTVVAVTAVNLSGLRPGKWAQAMLGIATCLGVLSVAGAGFLGVSAADVAPATASPAGASPAFGLAMVFVLLAFGGWNEAAYVSADVSRRSMVRALLWGIGTITMIYLLVNVAYVRGLGLAGLSVSQAPAAELVERFGGAEFAAVTSIAIALAALSTMNATTLTGGRSHLALGRDVPLFHALAQCDPRSNTPRTALLVQAGITLLLVLLGAFTRQGFVALVEYTAPVFWFFLLLVGVSLFVLRRKERASPGTFRVPLYPLTPLIFCGMCLYMVRSSLVHTGLGALVGAAVLLLGIPVLWLARIRETPASLLSRENLHP